MDIENRLRQIFYSLDSPASFGGARLVYKEAKKYGIPKAVVDEFLSRQKTYTLHSPYRKRIKHRKTTASGLDVWWQLDLADMQKLKGQNSGYGYFLVAVDVFSRYIWAVPVKTKMAKNVAEALKSIIISSKRKPWRLWTDQGTEFTGADFQKFCKEQNIFHFTSNNPTVKASLSERSIRTIKNRLWKYFTRMNTYRYIEVLGKITNNINSSINRTIGVSPKSINFDNQDQFRYLQIVSKKYKNRKPKFKLNDRVRTMLLRKELTKGYKANFSKDHYFISQIMARHPYQPTLYRVRNKQGHELKRIFYEPHLVKSIKSVGPYQKIQSITKSEQDSDGNIKHLVKWQNFQDKQWIDHENLAFM